MTNNILNANNQFEASGLKSEHWSTASPIRSIFKKAFAKAGLPYFHPHSFRNTLVQLGYEVCKKDIEALKAWSQNLGHSSVLTTLNSYGEVNTKRQADIIKNLAAPSDNKQLAENKLLDEIAEVIKKHTHDKP